MLKVHLLRKFAVYVEDDTPLAFRTRKAEAIFYYLVVAAKPVSRNLLAELFWPEMTTPNAQNNLRTILPELRHSLGDYLTITSQQVAFKQTAEQWVDLYQLQELLQNSSMRADEQLRQLIRLYKGPLLAGLTVANTPEFENWLHMQRDEVQEQVITKLQNLTESFLQQRSYTLGLETTQLWLSMQPWNETCHRLRMQLFWLSNQRSAALLQYNRCVDYLQEELGVEPSSETKRLYIQIQRQDLTDSAQPEHRQEAGKVPPRHNLLRQLTSFVGRERETALIQQYLLEQNIPIVSIIGDGGVGKTRLSLAIAESMVTHHSSDRYLDGVWFVSCVGIAPGASANEQILVNISAAIGMEFQGRYSFLHQLADYLSRKSLLLILDNFEHLLEHALLLVEILQQAPDVQILVTSRQNLRIQDALRLRLEGLEIPRIAQEERTYRLSDEELREMLKVASVQTFCDRVRKAWSAFTVTNDNGIYIAKLCQMLNGNPLAIELAATQISDYDVETLYYELSNNYMLLSSDLQDLPERQRSMHNTISHSWQLLSPELATLLAQCSCFRGSFTYHALTSITNTTTEEIDQLISRSLLSIDLQQRIQMHEMVRQFADRKLAGDEKLEQNTRRKYTHYYLELLIKWWEENENQHVVAYLRPEIDNVYAAWELAFKDQLFALLSRSIIAFTQYHYYSSYISDKLLMIESHYEELMYQRVHNPQIANNDSCEQLLIGLNYIRSLIRYLSDDYQQGVQLFKETQSQMQRTGHFYLHAYVERFIANSYKRLARIEEATWHFTESIRYAEQNNDPYAKTTSLTMLASLATQQGKQTVAASHLHEAYLLLQKYPDKFLEATYHNHCGDYYHAQGYWEEAYDSYQKSMQAISTGYNYHSLGKILWQSGRFELSKEYLERVDITNKINNYRYGNFWHIIWLIDFANLYIAWRKPEQSIFYSQLACEHAQKQGWKLLYGRALKAQGAAQIQFQQWQQAERNLTLALDIFTLEATVDHQCSALTQLIEMQCARGEVAGAAQNAEKLWKILEEGSPDMTNAEPIKARWACYLGFTSVDDGQAKAAIQSAYKLFQEQFAHIYDETWRKAFSTHIAEHHALLQVVNTTVV